MFPKYAEALRKEKERHKLDVMEMKCRVYGYNEEWGSDAQSWYEVKD